MPKERDPRPERDHTDASLEAERKRTDEEIRARSANIEEDSDAQVEHARQRARRVLAAARQRADAQLDATPDATGMRTAVEAARRIEDLALESEYSAADVELHIQREARQDLLEQLLGRERGETDRTLGSERVHADHAVAARDNFLGMVSHDLRTMLGGIAMHAAMVVATAPDDPAGRKLLGHGDSIDRLTRRMSRLIGDLLDVVSIEAGKLEIVAEPRDAGALLRDVVETFQPPANAHGVSLETHLEREALLGRFDHDRILQVLGNLVSNAMRYTPTGGRITIRVERLEPDVHFSVADTGSGIPASELDAIFDRFHQAGRLDRAGLGLGLYISRCIIEAHGGRIWAESIVGAGSTFHFTLPGAPS